MKVGALILAAGNGSRFNSSIPKQFHLLNGKKIYKYVLDSLISSNFFSTIGLVTNISYHKHLDLSEQYTVIEGGDTRQESVFLGLQALENIDYVVICDGVRPFLTLKILNAHIEKLKLGHVAVNTCIPTSDTINIQSCNLIEEIPPRENFLRGQTPQSFSYKKLLHAHKTTKKFFTDDCGLMLEKGHEVTYINGDETNIKITSSLDLDIASLLCKKDLTFSC